jgi:hypothetical protein
MYISVALSRRLRDAADCPPMPPTRDDRYCPYSSMSSTYRSVSISDIDVCAAATGETLKLAALVLAAKGHWMGGTGILIAAYAVSLLSVERLFKVLKPKLMTLNRFDRSWTWVTKIRNGAWARLRWRILENGLRTLKVRRSKS